MSTPTFPIILTPRDEVDAYAHLAVDLPSGIHEVNITKYRCANTKFGKSATQGGTQDAVLFKDRMLGKAGRALLNDMSPHDLVGVFLGKGSRRAIIQVLQWVDRLKLLSTKLSKQAALQKICDDYIGLDCNGFVGNWADENCVPKIGASTPPRIMGATFKDRKRASLGEIQPYDIFVWQDHVAAVESIGPVTSGRTSQRTALVGEAYGAIMCKPRVIRPGASAGTFQVEGHQWADAEAYGVGLGAAMVASPARILATAP